MSKWISAPLESEGSNNLIFGSVRTDVDKFRANAKFRYRLQVFWKYKADAKGMPSEAEADTMEAVADTLNTMFDKDPVAVMTEMITGDGTREMVFYTLSLHIFQRKINEALSTFPSLPLEFSATEDPDWEEYTQLLTIIKESDDLYDK